MTRIAVSLTLREVSFFTGKGDQVLFLRSKGGIKRFFKLKRGDHLYFLKKENILLNISGHQWNSCDFTEKVLF